MEKSNQQARAAVVRSKSGGFELENIQVDAPRRDEVLVKIVATGMCHTDMVARDQVYPVPHPIVLGHEGAGVVDAVGADVTKVSPGDHVVLSFLPCGGCRACLEGEPAHCENLNEWNFAGQRIDGSHALSSREPGDLHDRFFGQSSFATLAVANERNVVKVRKDVDLALLGPLGCGIQTGAGTVMNTLKVAAGDSFAAFGAGAVGLSAVMAAVASGATTVIAVDVVPSRLELAMEIGATHVVNSQEEDPVERILELTNGGVDFAVESTGIASVMAQAVAALRPRGSCATVGASPPGTLTEVDATDLMQKAKVIRGVVEGNSIPDLFIPRLIELYRAGRFPFDQLIRFYDFDQINQAAEDSESGETIKPVIRIG